MSSLKLPEGWTSEPLNNLSSKRFQKLKRSVQLRYAEAIDCRDYEPKIKKLRDTHIQANEVIPLNKPVDILDEQSLEAVKQGRGIHAGQSTAAQADTIAHATKKVIHEKMDEDPAFYEKFSKLIQQAIDDFKTRCISALDYLSQVSDIRDSVVFRKHEDVIDYELLIMNRKSLEIAVHPDKSVVVKAPSSSTLEAVEEKIKKRARWIKRQITYFNQFDPRTPDRKYVGGESHLYLGRKYRLKIETSDRDKVLLKNGYFCIEANSKQPDHIKRLMDMDAWYRGRARVYLYKTFDDCWEDFKKGDLDKPNLRLQKMDKRWGSLSRKGQLNFNVRLIQTPKECIEYVVIHELCHLIHPHQGPEFYRLLQHTMPDWMKRKHKLEMALI